MPSSFEKSVKGATKIKLAAPKSKYIEHIFVATHAGDAGVAEIFRTLQNRLRDSTWTIVFKSLIVVHLMIREGEPNVTLKFLAESPSKLAISNFSDAQVQGSNVRHYYTYLLVRAKAYRDTRLDWVREGQGRLKRQTVDKGLLRETEAVQNQISALLKCDILNNEPENEITLTAFRLLTMDLLVLFHVMNEGTINVLEHYFEMSKFDAERALNIYKNFSKQTNQVVEYLSTARSYENATRLEIPKLKHAPTSLTGSLEEYLQDPDFEINRRQYLAQQEAKKGRKNMSNGNPENSINVKASSSSKKPEVNPNFRFSDMGPPTPAKSEPKGPAPDLIDLFDSIEQNQQPMATQSQQISNFQNEPQFFQSQPPPQQSQSSTFPSQPQDLFNENGQPQQQGGASLDNNNSNPFGQSQSQSLAFQQPTQQNFTNTQFGTYPQQPFSQQQNPPSSMPQPTNFDYPHQQSPFGVIQQPQSSTDYSLQQTTFNNEPQPQSTNPFRQSTMPQPTTQTPQFTNAPPLPTSQPYQSTNPFARNLSPPQPGSQSQSSPFNSPPPQIQPNSSTAFAFSAAQPPQPLQATHTGTNPFARNNIPPQPTLSPLVPNLTGSTNPFRQSTFGPGWTANQGTMGGLEHLETVPVFPRPGQQPQEQGRGPGQGQGWP